MWISFLSEAILSMNRFLTHPTHYSASFNRDIQIDASKRKTSYHKERRFSRVAELAHTNEK